MHNTRKHIMATTLAVVTALSITTAALASEHEKAQPSAGMITKEQAIDKALADHPGEVTKTYMEKKRGKEVWEVKINGNDGKEWELYYDAATGELVKAESE